MTALSDRLTAEISKLSPGPGDLLLVKYPDGATIEDAGRVADILASQVREGVRVITCPAGYDIECHEQWRLVKSRSIGKPQITAPLPPLKARTRRAL